MTPMKEDLLKLINKIAEEQEYKNYEVVLNDLCTGGANFTSKLFTAVVKETNRDDLHLFIKVAAVGEKFRSEVGWQLFSTEYIAYTKLWDIYKTIEDENRVPEEHKLSLSKCYGFEPTLYQETLVLENLVKQGFNSFDRFTSIDWAYASSAITELAKFHALSFACSEQYPEVYENILADTKVEWKEGAADSMAQGTKVTALKNIRLEQREAVEENLENFMKDIFERFLNPIRKTVIVHGDYRCSNLMHKVREDGKLDIKIVDLQMLQGGSPVSDLLYFIFTSSDEKFRAQYYDKLVDHYYTQLCEAMKRLHLNPDKIYSREDYDYDLKEKLPYGLSMAVFVLPAITIDEENVPTEVNELTSLDLAKTSDLYVERLNGIVNDYVRWGLLKC